MSHAAAVNLTAVAVAATLPGSPLPRAFIDTLVFTFIFTLIATLLCVWVIWWTIFPSCHLLTQGVPLPAAAGSCVDISKRAPWADLRSCALSHVPVYVLLAVCALCDI